MNEQFTEEETQMARNIHEDAQPHWQQGKRKLRCNEILHNPQAGNNSNG